MTNPICCPFCGSPAEILKSSNDYIIHCSNLKCILSCLTTHYPTEEEAIEAWNKRTYIRSCRNCAHHIVCAFYNKGQDENDILAEGKPCAEFLKSF